MDGFFSRSQAAASARPAALSLPQCGRCGLLKTCRTPKMAPAGRGRRKILVVGSAPDRDDDAAGEPASGAAGDYLRDRLSAAGVDLDRDCWTTYALACHPSKGYPPPGAVGFCRPLVLAAFRELKPAVVLLLGADAVRSVVGHLWKEDVGAFARWPGYQIPAVALNAWVCPTHHPADLLAKDDPVLHGEFRRHVRDAVALDGVPYPDGPPDYEAACEVVVDADEAAARVARYRRRGGLVAFDFETDRLKPDAADARIVSCSVCWEGRETIAFPWRGAVRAETKALLEDPRLSKVGANVKFEHRWCAAVLGVEVRNWAFDTMMAAHILDARGGVTGLKFQAFARLGAPDFAAHVADYLGGPKGGNSPNNIHKLDLPTLLRYNAMDSLLEYRLAEVQAAELGWPLRGG